MTSGRRSSRSAFASAPSRARAALSLHPAHRPTLTSACARGAPFRGSRYPKNFKLDYALSREATNSKGGKMYIQDKVEEYADDIFNRLSNGAHIYFCGLKGMMPGIQDMLKEVCRKKGLTYDDFVADLKKKGQWRVEVY